MYKRVYSSYSINALRHAFFILSIRKILSGSQAAINVSRGKKTLQSTPQTLKTKVIFSKSWSEAAAVSSEIRQRRETSDDMESTRLQVDLRIVLLHLHIPVSVTLRAHAEI
jgi:hypothetical protein